MSGPKMKGRTGLLFSLIVAVYSSGISAQSPDCKDATVADIVFLVDGSSNNHPLSFQWVRHFLSNIIRTLDVGPNKVRIGLAQNGDRPYLEFLLKEHTSKQSLLDALEQTSHRAGGNELGKAFDFVMDKYFTKEAGSRANQSVPQIAVVITDRQSADDLVEPARRLRKHGVILLGIGVGLVDKDLSWLPKHFLITTDNYQALDGLTKRLLHTVCVTIKDQTQALADTFADIFFLVDGGISPGQFSLFKSELIKLVNQLSVSASTYRIGLAQYNQDVKVEFFLNTHRTRQEAVVAIRRFRQRPQPNQLQNPLSLALEYANTHFFTSEVGGRASRGFRQFLVVVSGDKSDYRVSRTPLELESAGITIVGMSAGAMSDEIDRFASDGYAFDSPRVTLLKDILTAKEKEDTTVECRRAHVADIVFIVDESGSIGVENFQLVRTFLRLIVSGLDVGPNRVRVGLVSYSTITTAHLYLDTFKDKDEILQYINILPYGKGGTKTGAALKFVQDEIFTEAKGSRKGIQRVAVVITDGQSGGNISEPAASLRRFGVTVYTIGIKVADDSELVEMASYPPYRHVFTVDSFHKLKPFQQHLQKVLCNNIIRNALTDISDIKDACVQKDEADIFFLMDDSGSIQPTDFDEMKTFISQFIHTFRIGPNLVRIGLVKYSDAPTLQFDLTTYSDADKLEKAVKDIWHAGGGTRTGDALSFMDGYFESALVSRGHSVPQYLIIITDGKSSDGVKAPAEKLRNKGIVIYAIGVKESNQEELQEIAGDQKKTFFVRNFDALKSIKDDVTSDICSPVACRDVPLDIVFLADSSESISEVSFGKMKDFIKSVIGKAVIGRSAVHCGVMQFSSKQNLEFDLSRYYSKDDMFQAIDAMQQMNEGTLTGAAIREVSQYFKENKGGRPGLVQNLVVITDGKAQDEVASPAAALRSRGVVIYTIGVEKANISQMAEISGSSEQVFYEKDFNALEKLGSQLAVKLCKEGCKRTEIADIIFLVDGSSSIHETQFASMQMFMRSIVNRTTVGENKTQFGVILYSNDARSVFNLNTYKTKKDVLNAISSLTAPTGETYTSKALKFSLEYFAAHYGGRKELKVPQILMVITDGEATDPQDLKPSADELRQDEVTVFSIGVGKAKKTELDIMAGGDTSKVFYVHDFMALETLYKNVSSGLCFEVKPVCERDKTDVVFLLDRSGSITLDNYTMMINFMTDLVNSFEVGEEFVHVGLAQFSDSPLDEFHLNQYTKKEEMIEHIQKMEYKGGNTNIGKALAHIKTYFDVSQGSRRLARIPQNLVLITDGDSHDDVEDPANEVRDLGITVFAIGVGDVHDLELLQITGTPERLYNVQNFRGLSKIREKVVDNLCQTEPVIDKRCTIDIAMGFDISQRTGTLGEILVNGHTVLKTSLSYLSMAQDLCCADSTLVKTNIAYQLVDSSGNPLYDTNFEAPSEDVLKKVMDFQMTQPSSFSTTLLDSFKGLFQARSTARVKVLVIFSDGLDEDVMKLQEASAQLQQSGISALLVVALDGVRDPTRLQAVEFGRGFTYQRPLSINMLNFGSAIFSQINAASEWVCCGIPCKCLGHEGARGIPGPPGTKGLTGKKGQPGFPGDEGFIGERGPPGPIGSQGLQGCPGAIGQKGHRGISGNMGENGEDGLDGINGEQGVTGPDGARGARGHLGNPGIPGIRGEPGLKGERGLRGDPGVPGANNTVGGPKGDPGNPGLMGPTGQDGRPGGAGDSGNQGPDGRRGPTGEKGAPGEPGAKGLKGSPGGSGPQGRSGGSGERGPKGIPGFPGPQGKHGTGGNPGTLGRRGPNGPKGQPGDPGPKGAPGSQGPRGMPGLDGRDGSGSPGPKGAKGDVGFTGFPGRQGEDGEKGTKGYPGLNGNRGQRGYSGSPGQPGVPGDPGCTGHRGPRGLPGDRTLTECQLITLIRNNCACSPGQSECPAYPTELVFGLDMSENVTLAAFEKQRTALLSLLEDISIAESNCPTGARVAVVGYSAYIKYLIRFQDYRLKRQLIDFVKNIALERTSNRRHLAAAMRFVGQNVFKRVRTGMMMRKVAVFFSDGNTQDVSDILTAVMEYRALDIVLAVISTRNAPPISRAMEVDDSGQSIFTVLGRDVAADLRKVKNCAICYDPCRRSEDCAFIQQPLPPQEADVDLVMMVDSSREVQADEYAGVQELLGSVVEQLAVSQQPRRAGSGARVAVVQQSGNRAAKVEFGLQTYQDRDQMRTHVVRNMQQQGGSSTLGQTLDFTLKEVLLKAGQPRRKKALLAVVGTQTAHADRAKLRYVSQKAKCEGVALFVVTVGDRYSRAQVEELASLPVQQHLIHVGRLKPEEQDYAQRFFRVFLAALNKGMNKYPPPSVKQTCGQLIDPDEVFLTGQGSAEPEVELQDEPEQRFWAARGDGPEQPGGGHGWTSRSPADGPNALPKTERSAFVSPDACSLWNDPGSCHNYSLMWFFDAARDKCSRFLYGGCGGNENRFKTREDCEKLSVPQKRGGYLNPAHGAVDEWRKNVNLLMCTVERRLLWGASTTSHDLQQLLNGAPADPPPAP